MVVLEVTLSFVLLVGAGLMVRSFVALQTADPGFNPQGVMTFNLNLPNDKYPTPDVRFQFVDQLYERIGQMPGVEDVGTIGPLPLTGGGFNGRYATEENSGNMESYRQADYRSIKGDYFQTMETELLAGRDRTVAGPTAPPQGLVFLGPLYPDNWHLPAEVTL